MNYCKLPHCMELLQLLEHHLIVADCPGFYRATVFVLVELMIYQRFGYVCASLCSLDCCVCVVLPLCVWSWLCV